MAKLCTFASIYEPGSERVQEMMEYKQSAWSLEDLFSSNNGGDVLQALDDLEISGRQFELYREILNEDMDQASFSTIVSDYEELNKKLVRLHGFASLDFAANTQDQSAQTFLARIQQITADIENRMMFFSLWWKRIGQSTADRLMAEAGDLNYWLKQMRLFKPHTLSEPEERVINLKNISGMTALHTLYDLITNRYGFQLQVEGELKELTRGELMVYVRGQDSALRKAAYQELYRVYGDDGPILGQIYQTLVRDWRNEQISLRNFGTPLAARNLGNDIPDQVVETLLRVSEQNASLFQRYFRLKSRLLGMERLRRYDIYAPVVQVDKRFSFQAGSALVLDSFRQFDSELANLARRVFDQGHLDSLVRKGKRSGAFCDTITPELTPWVLVNYQGRTEDVATLAHELGHAVHSMLAENHSLFTQQASLPLAETASTFGEMMLLDRMLAQEQDDSVKRALLFRKVDDSYSTILRQAFFAIFEKKAHEMVAQGASVNEIANAYQENLALQFGDAVEVGDEFRWEWVSIPHIYHTPFYVYAYAFGQLLVLSLYNQFREEGDSFKPRYLKILSSGGSNAPVKILADAGVDIYDENFWQAGFDLISRQIDQLEAL
jgi:oligoendopeptidase F